MYYINPKWSLELNLMESHNSHFESIICPRFQVLQKNPKSMMLRIRKERGKKKKQKKRKEREVTHIQAQTSSAFVRLSTVSKGQAQTKLI